MGAFFSIPLTTALALPLLSSYSTSFNLLFFALNWYILLLTHTTIAVELYGLVTIRLFFFLLPALAFFAFDAGIPGVSEQFKAHGKYGLPTRLNRNKAWKVVGVAAGNTVLGVALTLGLEVLFSKVLMVKSLLNVSKQLPFPWQAVQSVVAGLFIRGLLQYLIHRFILHNPRFRTISKWHLQWQHSIAAPFALVAAYDHPVCYLLHHWIPLYLPAFLFRTHLLPFLFILAMASSEELFTYSGYSILPSTILVKGMARRVDGHFLAKGKGNYAAFGAVDWVSGTSLGGDLVIEDLKKEWDKHGVSDKLADGADGAGNLLEQFGIGMKDASKESGHGKRKTRKGST